MSRQDEVDRTPAHAGEVRPEDADLGPPLSELAEYSVPAAPDLKVRIRNSIERRNLAAEITGFSIFSLFSVLMEYLGSAFEALAAMTALETRDTEANEDDGGDDRE
jgi:hypothetical protein